jgi:hypothetical protein
VLDRSQTCCRAAVLRVQLRRGPPLALLPLPRPHSNLAVQQQLVDLTSHSQCLLYSVLFCSCLTWAACVQLCVCGFFSCRREWIR